MATSELEQQLAAARAEVERLEAAVEASKKGARVIEFDDEYFIYFDGRVSIDHGAHIYANNLPADIPAENLAALCASYREVAAWKEWIKATRATARSLKLLKTHLLEWT